MTHPHRYATDRFALRLGSFYAAYFLFGGIQLPFFPLWLEARGFDARAIGIAIALPMIVRIVVVPIATHQADRLHALKAALVISSVGGMLAMALAGLVDGVLAIMTAFVLAAMFFSPALPITDAYALTGLRPRGIAYGPVRLWGSVAFIVGNVGAGLLLERIAPGHLIWLIAAALALASIASMALVPLERAEPVAGESNRSLRELLGSPAFLAVVGAAALVQGGHALFYGFSTLQWRAAGISGPVIGMLWALGVFAEIVLFALSSRLPASLPSTALLSIGAAGAVLRWTAMAFDPPVALLPVLQLLHAASFGATHLGTMSFLARAVPRGFAATAQGALGTVSGVVMASATALSGALYASAGGLAYLAMAAMALAGLALALLAGRLSSRA